MTITVVQTKQSAAGTGNPLTVSFTSTPSVGNSVIVIVAGNQNGGVASVTDNQTGNTYYQIVTAHDTSALLQNACYSEIWWCPSLAGSSGTFTVTVTQLNNTGAWGAIGLMEVSNLGGIDRIGSANDGGTNPTSLTVAASGANSNANDLVICAFGSQQGGGLFTTTPTSGYTGLIVYTPGTQGPETAAGYKTVSAIETSQAVSQTGTGGKVAGCLATFTPALLQSASGSSNGHTTVTAVFGSPISAGSLLVAYVGSPNQGQTCSASDTINGAYNTDLAHPSGGLSICSFPNSPAIAANLTVTGSITGGVVPLTMIIEEWAGVRGTSPLDKTASQSNTAAVSGTTGTTAALSQPYELVLAAMEDNSSSGTGAGSTFAVSSPYTADGNSPVAQGAGIYNLAVGYLRAATTGTQSAQFTWGNSSGTRGIIATYKTNIITVNPLSITSSEGTPGEAISYKPSAYTVTSAEGTVTPALAVTGPAETLTFTEGSIVGAINLTAQTITSTEGTVSVSISGDVSLALGAIQTQFVEGVPIFVVSYTLDQNLFVLVGQTATFSEGALALEVDQFPTAQTVTSTEGTIAAEQLSVTLGSLNITSAEGLIVANAGNNFNNNLTAQTIQSQLFLGVPPASVSYPITAQSGTLVEGTITFSNTTNFSVNLVGQLAVFTEGIIVRNVPQGTGPPLFIPPQLGKPVTTRTFSWSEMAQRAWGSEFRAPDHRIYQFSGGNYKDSTDLGTTGIYSPNLGTPDNP